MGFSLKHLEKNKAKLENLREKILKKYGPSGLHVAELVKCGIFSRYVHLLIGTSIDEKELEEKIQIILTDIDKYVLFIQAHDNSKTISKKIITKIDANNPKAIIIFSKGKAAMKIAKKSILIVKKNYRDYKLETQFEPETHQQYDFLLKTDAYQ